MHFLSQEMNFLVPLLRISHHLFGQLFDSTQDFFVSGKPFFIHNKLERWKGKSLEVSHQGCEQMVIDWLSLKNESKTLVSSGSDTYLRIILIVNNVIKLELVNSESWWHTSVSRNCKNDIVLSWRIFHFTLLKMTELLTDNLSWFFLYF